LPAPEQACGPWPFLRLAFSLQADSEKRRRSPLRVPSTLAGPACSSGVQACSSPGGRSPPRNRSPSVRLYLSASRILLFNLERCVAVRLVTLSANAVSSDAARLPKCVTSRHAVYIVRS